MQSADSRLAGTPALRTTMYFIEPGDIESASLQNGRLRMTLKAHLALALGFDRCLWSSPGAGTRSGEQRSFIVDLPYTVYVPPPPPPPPMTTILHASATTICRGECTTLSAETSHGAGEIVYQWEHGLPGSPGPHRVCPSATTSYLVRARDSGPYTPLTAPQTAYAMATIVVRQDCSGAAPPPVTPVDCERLLRADKLPTEDHAEIYDGRIAANPGGDVFVTGAFFGALELGGTQYGGVDGLWGTTGGARGFVAKYDAACNLKWSRRLAAWPDYVQLRSAAADALGGLYLVGSAEGTHEPFRETRITSRTSLLFVAHLGRDGEVLSLHTRALPAHGEVRTAAVDRHGNALLVACGQSGLDLGTGPVTFPDDAGCALLRTNAQGTPLFVRSLHNTFAPEWVDLDASGASYLAGTAEDTLQIGAGPILSSAGRFRYLARLDESGQLGYQRLLSAATTATPEDLDPLAGVDEAGHVLIANSWRDYAGPANDSVLREQLFDPLGNQVRDSYRTSASPVLELQALEVRADGSYISALSSRPRGADGEPEAIDTPLVTGRARDGTALWQRGLAAVGEQRQSSLASAEPGRFAVLSALRNAEGQTDRLRLSRLQVP